MPDRVMLTVTVDLADRGEMSRPADWQQWLWKLLMEQAGLFRPVVAVNSVVCSDTG